MISRLVGVSGIKVIEAILAGERDPDRLLGLRILVATVALARKLAVLFWRVMVKGLSDAEAGLKAYEEQVLESKRRALCRLAKPLGRVVLPSLAELQTAESESMIRVRVTVNSPPRPPSSWKLLPQK